MLFVALAIHFLSPTVIGLFVMLFYSPRSVRLTWCAIEIRTRRIIPARMGGQTVGFFIFHRKDMYPRFRSHERVHVFQYLLFGPLFFLVYFGHSLILKLRGADAYRGNFLERWANAWEKGERR